MQARSRLLPYARTSHDRRHPAGPIEQRIVILRGQRVMLDADLAGVYGVTTKPLNEQGKHKRERFCEDFMFHLTEVEAHVLWSQFATTRQRGGCRLNVVEARTHRHSRFIFEAVRVLMVPADSPAPPRLTIGFAVARGGQ